MIMTNILCTIIVTVTTNWMTISTTSPARPDPSGGSIPAVMLFDVAHQIGARVTNTVVLVPWKGKTNQIIVESSPLWFEVKGSSNYLERSVTVIPDLYRFPPSGFSVLTNGL
jgi:hypothetical protein